MELWLARRASDDVYTLAEGPVWDAPRQQLVWVDIEAGAVLRGTLTADDRIVVTDRQEFPERIGAAVVAVDGRMMVAGERGLITVDPDGARTPGAMVTGPGRRLNDGKTDPAGRFVVGSMALSGPTHSECLVRIESDGTVTSIDSDLSLSNGLGWSVDGSRFFSTDTATRRVYVRAYDATTGDVGPRTVFLALDVDPDGLCVDAQDHLWIAIWGGAEVRRYSPDGVLVGRIDVPAPHTTSVAFAGADLDRLVITSARADLTDAQLDEFPDSGALFAVRVGVKGRDVPAWAG